MRYPIGKTCTRCNHKRHVDKEGKSVKCKELTKFKATKGSNPCKCVGFTGLREARKEDKQKVSA